MKRYRRKLKLKQEVKNTLIILFIILLIFILLGLIEKIDSDFIESCTNAGYSLEHCIKNK